MLCHVLIITVRVAMLSGSTARWPVGVKVMEKQTLTVEEAAKMLGISRNSAYEGVRSGEIPSIKVGRRLLVPRTALERFLANPDGTADSANRRNR